MIHPWILEKINLKQLQRDNILACLLSERQQRIIEKVSDFRGGGWRRRPRGASLANQSKEVREGQDGRKPWGLVHIPCLFTFLCSSLLCSLLTGPPRESSLLWCSQSRDQAALGFCDPTLKIKKGTELRVMALSSSSLPKRAQKRQDCFSIEDTPPYRYPSRYHVMATWIPHRFPWEPH